MCLEFLIPKSGLLKGPRNEDQADPIRFFMTGLSSAGKTTIIRQLLLLCNQKRNYSFCNESWQEERYDQGDNEFWIETIRKNVLDAFYILIKQIKSENISFDNEDDEEFANIIEDIFDLNEEIEHEMENTPNFSQRLLSLLQSQPIQSIWKRRNKVQVNGRSLFDGCEYFLNSDKIAEVFDSSYEASDRDKLHLRWPTTTMENYRFKINDTKFMITDVGGGKIEREKMIDYLQNWSFSHTKNSFILLVVSMSDFNVIENDHEMTRLDEAIGYMEVLLNNPVAQSCGLFIFFNKTDRFNEKLLDPECRDDIKYLSEFIKPSELAKYRQGKFNETKMQNAIFNKFKKALEDIGELDRNAYCKFTCAVDTKLMDSLFCAIQNEQIENFISDN